MSSVTAKISNFRDRFPEPTSLKTAELSSALDRLNRTDEYYLNHLEQFFDKLAQGFALSPQAPKPFMSYLSRWFFRQIDLFDGALEQESKVFKTQHGEGLYCREFPKLLQSAEVKHWLSEVVKPVVKIDKIALKVWIACFGILSMQMRFSTPTFFTVITGVTASISGLLAGMDYASTYKKPKYDVYIFSQDKIKEAVAYRKSLFDNWELEQRVVLATYQIAIGAFGVASLLKALKRYPTQATAVQAIAACMIGAKWAYDAARIGGLFSDSTLFKFRQKLAEESKAVQQAIEELEK